MAAEIPPSFSLPFSPTPPSCRPSHFAMYVAGHIGWPPGFYFQATFWMSEKLHGAIRETQHAGGALSVLLFLLSSLFLHHPKVQGEP